MKNGRHLKINSCSITIFSFFRYYFYYKIEKNYLIIKCIGIDSLYLLFHITDMDTIYESDELELESSCDEMDSDYDPSCLYCRYKNMTHEVEHFGKKIESYLYKDIINLLNEEGIQRLLIDKGTQLGDLEMVFDGNFCLDQMYEFHCRFDGLIKYFEGQIIRIMGFEEGYRFIKDVRHREFIPEKISDDHKHKLESMSREELLIEKSIVESKMIQALRQAMIFDYSDFLPYYNAIEEQL